MEETGKDDLICVHHEEGTPSSRGGGGGVSSRALFEKEKGDL